ncbi:hypothetical protein HPB52_013181 [Rhipicephalus sanguineus]|uniref:RNA helicase n=1 Tax=Rhipicephalus sanguineus TaxID=34632 RepID=A0A9D4SMU3_RHISA|nr:hypothetical protein HPB52_013181 [Rhipicephalus sanguineus]
MFGQFGLLGVAADVVFGVLDAAHTIQQQLNVGFQPQPQPWQFGVGQLNGPNNMPINGPNEGVLGANVELVDAGVHLRRRRSLRLRRGVGEQIPPSGDAKRVVFVRYPTGGGNGVSTTAWNSQLRAPDWREVHLPPFQKDVYQEHITAANRPMEEVDAYRKANGITVTGRDVPKPILYIDESGIPERVAKVIEARNPRSTPSPVQAQCWPVALSGRDLVAVINDGSRGEPLAYLVPAIMHILLQPTASRDRGPLVLLLTATREEAIQVRAVADELTEGLDIRAMYLLPGEPRELQLKQIEEGAQICVATPGRLVSFMEECRINLSHCSYLVLDEADRMISMGFEKQLRVIADYARPDRQTLVWLTSRTMDANRLIDDLTSDYVNVSVGAVAREDQKAQHIVYVCEALEKEEKLVTVLNDVLREKDDKAIVFTERKRTVEDIVSKLRLRCWACVAFHGKKTKQERHWALNSVRLGDAPILVSTDAAAGSVSLDNVRLVLRCGSPCIPNSPKF